MYDFKYETFSPLKSIADPTPDFGILLAILNLLSMSKTFKINRTDLPFEEICEDFSQEDTRYLAIKHVTSKRKHVHVYIEDPVDDMQKRIKTYNKQHKEEGARQGPWKLCNKTLDPQFLNYMCKEEQYKQNVVANQGFTEEDLYDFHQASVEYRMTHGLRGWFTTHWPKQITDPASLHMALKRLAMGYYVDQAKVMPPNLKMMILSYMCQLSEDENVMEYACQFL